MERVSRWGAGVAAGLAEPVRKTLTFRKAGALITGPIRPRGRVQKSANVLCMEVAGAVGGLVDAQGPLEELHGEGVLAQLPAGAAQVGEGDGHPGVVGAVGGLVDAQGPLKELHGCGVLAQLPAGVAQVGEVSRSL
jgi:hypothetical protein